MAKKPLHRLMSLVVDVRPEETFVSALMFIYFFLLTSSAYIIKAVKISLFLDRLTFTRLPYAYLGTAALIGFVVALNTRLLRVMKRHQYISLSIAFFTLCLFLFWLALSRFPWPWISLLYWFWADVYLIVSITQFWILMNDIYFTRQARRLVGFFVSGGLLGGVAGSLQASFLARRIGTENLLLLCPLFLVLCLVIVNMVPRFYREGKEVFRPREEPGKTRASYGKGFRQLAGNRYLLLLSGMMGAGIIVSTFVDFQFNSVVGMTFGQRKDAMTSFLGTFFTGLLVVSYLLHILLTNRVLKNFGMRGGLLVAPLALVACALAVFFVPGAYLLYWAIIIRGADKSLSHSLSQSVRELLYIPVPSDVKYRAKVFIDMFVNKFADGLAALILLLTLSLFHFKLTHISIVTLVFIGLWIIFNLLITREYVEIVKRNLRVRWQDAEKLVRDAIDIDMTKLVFDTVQSRAKSSVLYAMNLFDLLKRRQLSPELKKVIAFKSDEIKARSMDSLLDLDGEVLIPEMDDTLETESFEAEVAEIMSLDVYQELMRAHIEKVAGKGGKETEVARMEAAKMLGMMEPGESLARNLRTLLKDESPEVIKYACESAGKKRKRELVPQLVRHLGKPATRESAQRALEEYGDTIVGTLRDYLADPEEDIRLRKMIPGLLAHAGSQRAADLLLLELNKGKEDMDAEIIESLFRIRKKHPGIVFGKKPVLCSMFRLLRKCYMVLVEIKELRADERRAVLAKDLESSLARTMKHAFELLSLIYPHEDITRAYQNMTAGTKKATDYAVELLDNLLSKEIKEALLPLIEDTPWEDKVRAGKKLLKALEKGYN